MIVAYISFINSDVDQGHVSSGHLDKSLCDLPILIGLTSSNLKEHVHIHTVGSALQTLSPLGGLSFQAL